MHKGILSIVAEAYLHGSRRPVRLKGEDQQTLNFVREEATRPG